MDMLEGRVSLKAKGNSVQRKEGDGVLKTSRLLTGVESEKSQSVEGLHVNSGFTSPQEGTELRRCDDSTC